MFPAPAPSFCSDEIDLTPALGRLGKLQPADKLAMDPKDLAAGPDPAKIPVHLSDVSLWAGAGMGAGDLHLVLVLVLGCVHTSTQQQPVRAGSAGAVRRCSRVQQAADRMHPPIPLVPARSSSL